MKSDIDSLMAEENLDAILIVGPTQHNPPMGYFTTAVHMPNADLIKKRGEPPVLFHMPMERDEAAKTGLKTSVLDAALFESLIRQYPSDVPHAYSLLYQKMFAELGIQRGRVAVYGQTDVGRFYGIFSELSKVMPELVIVGEAGRSMLLTALETKDQAEVDRIRGIGRVAVNVIAQVADFLTSHRVSNQILIKQDGNPLTILDVKRRIDLWLAERSGENPRGAIFAAGYDAGVPHSTGTAGNPLRLGQTIIFDFFPREAGGGYFYDITRTWCLGYATDEAYSLYEDVLHVFQACKGAYRLGSSCRDYQELACDLFEARGHPTLRTDANTTSGYVHSLGHGVGLNIHELPTFRSSAPENDRIKPGAVFTVEPGLYYPERGMGVRLEDTLWARPDGVFETLAEYPLDLVLPMKNGG